MLDKLHQVKHFSERDARDICRCLIDALRYLHEMGIVHRDIKVENLLFPSTEFDCSSIRLADFGLAKIFEPITDSIAEKFASTTCGTPAYMAPEVLFSTNYDQACDYWSIGVVTFILLSGLMPFWAKDNMELFQKIKKGAFDFSDESWKVVSEEAKDFVSALLKPDPKARLNCEQMLEHPWLTMELASEALSINRNALEAHLTARKKSISNLKELIDEELK